MQQAGDPNWSVDGEAWLAWPIRQRWLASFRRALAAHGREIAQVIADEIGKPESEAYVSEVLPLLAAMRWHARHARGVLRTQRATASQLGPARAVEQNHYECNLLYAALLLALTACSHRAPS